MKTTKTINFCKTHNTEIANNYRSVDNHIADRNEITSLCNIFKIEKNKNA